jgi:hypothetical protein
VLLLELLLLLTGRTPAAQGCCCCCWKLEVGFPELEPAVLLVRKGTFSFHPAAMARPYEPHVSVLPFSNKKYESDAVLQFLFSRKRSRRLNKNSWTARDLRRRVLPLSSYGAHWALIKAKAIVPLNNPASQAAPGGA